MHFISERNGIVAVGKVFYWLDGDRRLLWSLDASLEPLFEHCEKQVLTTSSSPSVSQMFRASRLERTPFWGLLQL